MTWPRPMVLNDHLLATARSSLGTLGEAELIDCLVLLLDAIERDRATPQRVMLAMEIADLLSAEALDHASERLAKQRNGDLDEALLTARRIAGQERFDRWLARRRLQPTKQGRVARSQEELLAAHHDATPFRHRVRPTRGPACDSNRYTLEIEETRISGTLLWFTRLRVEFRDTPPARWGFMMSFDASAETEALAHAGLDRERQEILATTSYWNDLKDLLLPFRFGDSGDELLSAGCEGQPGRLPGPPRAIEFWIIPSPAEVHSDR
jgi:hypothetical protein